eukprot:COSAG02_NODE_38732_length_425_cov_1.429448_1_plen_69_part_10
MPLRLFDLKHLTSGHPTLQIADLWMRGGIDFSSSEPLNVHFTFSAFRIGHSHEKKRNNLPPCGTTDRAE